MRTTTMTRDFASARKAMIDSQLRTSGVNEEYVLARMMAVPREDFLPADKAGLAYIDRSVEVEPGQRLASPLFYGKLLSEAAPFANDSVLVVEGGTGYLTELVRPLVESVTAVSSQAAAAGEMPKGSHSLVLVDGAIEMLTDALTAAVADGGKIVTGLAERGVTRLASGRKIAASIVLQPIEDIGIPVLHGFDKPKGWTF